MAWVMAMAGSLGMADGQRKSRKDCSRRLGGVMVVCGGALMLPTGLRHAVLPHDLGGHGDDDCDRGPECAGQDCDLNRQGTQLGECCSGDCCCEKWYEHGVP